MLIFGFRQQLASTWKTQSLIWARHALCAVVFVLLVVGCGSGITSGSQPSNAIVGKWIGPCNNQNSDFTYYGAHLKQIEFLTDGTFIWDGNAGTYSILPDSRVKIAFPVAQVVYGFSVSGNTLTFTSVSGTTCNLTRAT